MILFYCGVNETTWNKHQVAPGALACVSPVYGASKRTKTENRIPTDLLTEHIIQDSGAFCDGPEDRLSFAQAMHRQVVHALKYKYERKIEAVATYDLLNRVAAPMGGLPVSQAVAAVGVSDQNSGWRVVNQGAQKSLGLA